MGRISTRSSCDRDLIAMLRPAVLALGVLIVSGALDVATAQPRAAEEAATTAQDSEAASPFNVEGRFDVGFRWSDSSGNEDKFFEDLNYRTGPRLFDLDLSVTPTNEGAFDLLRVDASGLGDPFQSFGVTLKQHGKFNFRFRRNESQYFYRDTLVPHDLADIDKSTGGDFHTFDFNRVNDVIDFDVKFGRRADVFVKFNRQTRLGESTTTLDISRDEFEFDRPLDETKNDYTVGVQLYFDRASVYFDQTYRDYETDNRLFLPGASLGENAAPDDPTELFFYEQLLPYDFTMPQSTAKVNVRPNDRLTVNAGFVVSDLDAQFSEEETARGVAFTGAPLATFESGRGSISRTTTLTDIDAVYDINEHVAAIGGFRYSDLDQQGEFRLPDATQRTSLEVSTGTLEFGAQVYPMPAVTVTGGYRYENRDTRFGEGDTEDSADAGHAGVDTTQNSLFFNGVYAPSSQVNLLAEYERGSYDNPFTLVAPTSMDRVKVRVRLRPITDLALVGTFLTRRLENDLGGGVHPTQPRTGEPATLRTSDFTVHAAYGGEPYSVFGSYSRRDISNEVLNQVVTAPGFLGGISFDIDALYESSIDMGSGGARVVLSDSLTLGTEIVAYRNRGTFGLDWEQYRLFVELPSPAAYVLKLSYQYNALNEQQFDFDDYSSHVVTVSTGYGF
jgi:hypothetical protein